MCGALRCPGYASPYRRRCLFPAGAGGPPSAGRGGLRPPSRRQSHRYPSAGSGGAGHQTPPAVSAKRYRLLKQGAEGTQHILNNMCLVFCFLNIPLRATPEKR